MRVQVKICGLKRQDVVDAAVAGGAAFVGFNFYLRSPRAVSPVEASALAATVPAGVTKVGLFVDAELGTLAATLAAVPLDLIQLHGHETPARVAEIRRMFGVPVMKVLPIAGVEDVAAVDPYLPVADRLMFDARPPKDASALPGGNGVAFDWQLIAGRTWPLPWMLAGGLTAGTLAEAVRISGAQEVDVSSGVEERPGVKSIARIQAFLAAAAAL